MEDVVIKVDKAELRRLIGDFNMDKDIGISRRKAIDWLETTDYLFDTYIRKELVERKLDDYHLEYSFNQLKKVATKYGQLLAAKRRPRN